ncbi:hypothetical protein BY458DRAFT_442926 [Sporodiniella umbellata]|nr:hypothetical protein BY458DRAFT_442926 [Sporodiniella umbellata]
MAMRKEATSHNSPFIEYVVLPTIRMGALLVACVMIGLGSWLETNDGVTDCGFKSSLSLHQVYMYRNISSNITTPDSVSFGLWKHCYIYPHNCSCTPTSLKYQPDVSTILQIAATTHNALAPVSQTTSLGRSVPLILATIMGVLALLLGLYTNKRGIYLYRRWTVGLIGITAFLLSLCFGYSYHQYFQWIKATCASTSNDVYCARHKVQTEVVLLAVAIVSLFFALVFWISAAAWGSKSNRDTVARSRPEPTFRIKRRPETLRAFSAPNEKLLEKPWLPKPSLPPPQRRPDWQPRYPLPPQKTPTRNTSYCMTPQQEAPRRASQKNYTDPRIHHYFQNTPPY